MPPGTHRARTRRIRLQAELAKAAAVLAFAAAVVPEGSSSAKAAGLDAVLAEQAGPAALAGSEHTLAAGRASGDTASRAGDSGTVTQRLRAAGLPLAPAGWAAAG